MKNILLTIAMISLIALLFSCKSKKTLITDYYKLDKGTVEVVDTTKTTITEKTSIVDTTKTGIVEVTEIEIDYTPVKNDSTGNTEPVMIRKKEKKTITTNEKKAVVYNNEIDVQEVKGEAHKQDSIKIEAKHSESKEVVKKGVGFGFAMWGIGIIGLIALIAWIKNKLKI